METEPLLGTNRPYRRLHNTNENDRSTEMRNVHDFNERESEVDVFAVACILLTELCERLVYYSVLVNMILFCTSKLEMSSTTAATINLVFSGSVFIVPVFGGYIADTLTGKYKAIFGSGIILIIGLILLLASSIDYVRMLGPLYSLSTKSTTILYITSLVLMIIGSGGIKSNIGPLGAQQVECRGSQAVQSFFNWFYWIINIGAVIASSVVAYVQQNIGFFYGYLIPLIVMILAQIIFSLSKNRYVTTSVEGSPVREIFGVCCASRCLSFDGADNEHGGQFSSDSVSRVRSFFRLLPVCGLVIIYWTVYSQMTSTFFLQSERMDISVGTKQVPIAVLNSFNSIAIIILVPVMELLIYPCLRRINHTPTLLQRMGIGMLLAMLSVLVAGILEIYRKKDLSVNQTLFHDHFNASSISVFAQIPQFTLIGVSEVFTSITGMEFAYTEAPNMMKGVCMGLFLETTGVGSYVALLLIVIVKAVTGSDPPDSWFPNDINQGKTEYLFFMLAILLFLNFVLFSYVASCYKYNQANDQTVRENEAD